MTREEARKAVEVMTAYAEGKNVEYCRRGDPMWFSATTPTFDWYTTNYRIKPEPTYRPFNDKGECWAEMQRHQPFGWVTNEGEKFINIFNIDDTGVDFIDDGDLDSLGYVTAIKRLNFIDGTPFGIKEK